MVSVAGCGKGEIGEDIAIGDQGGFAGGAEKIEGIGEAASAIEEDFFVAKGEGGLAVVAGGEGGGVGSGEVMGIEQNAFRACIDDVIEKVSDEGATTDRNERLGEVVGEGTESGAETGSEDECIFHESSIAEALVLCKN